MREKRKAPTHLLTEAIHGPSASRQTRSSFAGPLLQSYLVGSREAPRSLAEREDRLRALFAAMAAVLLTQDAQADELRVRPAVCACGGRWQSNGHRKRALVTPSTK